MADESTWAEYVRLFELVNQAAGLAGSLEVLAEKDRFARAITGDRALDLWRAWRDARTSSSKERPLEATRRIKRARRLHPEDSNRGLVDIEIDALMGQCALELQAGGLGREYWDRVRNEILSFASMVRDKPEWAAKQVAGMLGCLMGVSDVEYRGSAQDICHAWALARGTKLVLEATSQLLTVSWHRDDLSEIADRARFDLNEFCKRA